MPQLKWTELDLLGFFCVSPDIGDDGPTHHYEIERNGLRLHFSIWQWDGRVQISLLRGVNEEALCTFKLYVRGEVRVINDKCGERLEIEDCVITAPDYYGFGPDCNVFDREQVPFSATGKITLDPDIRIAFSDFHSRS